MWRSFFLALGVFLFILGAEALVVERAVLNRGESQTAADIVPPEWAPWSLLSAGAVVVLYSFTVPKKMSG
jgi:hypothetical protein